MPNRKSQVIFFMLIIFIVFIPHIKTVFPEKTVFSDEPVFTKPSLEEIKRDRFKIFQDKWNEYLRT